MSRFTVAFVISSTVLVAQVSRISPGDLPRQAKAPEEFDLYLDFEEARDAEVERLAAVHFEQAYPQSERNLSDTVRSAGEKTLSMAPDNFPVLLELAEVIPGGVVDAQWFGLRRQIRSWAHAAFGLVGVKCGAVLSATREFETAVSENPDADGVQLYRLAKLYRASGRHADATALLQKTFLIGPPEISSRVAVELTGER